MHKQEVQETTASRLETMGILVATHYYELISALVQKEKRRWLGFLRIDLLNLEIDGIVVLNGDCIFTL